MEQAQGRQPGSGQRTGRGQREHDSVSCQGVAEHLLQGRDKSGCPTPSLRSGLRAPGPSRGSSGKGIQTQMAA